MFSTNFYYLTVKQFLRYDTIRMNICFVITVKPTFVLQNFINISGRGAFSLPPGYATGADVQTIKHKVNTKCNILRSIYILVLDEFETIPERE